MPDHAAAIEAAAQCLYEHRAVGGEGDCACGWMGNGFAHAHRLHVIERLTSPWVPCPTCRGTNYQIGVDSTNRPCPDCTDGTVPADPYLVWAEPEPIERAIRALHDLEHEAVAGPTAIPDLQRIRRMLEAFIHRPQEAKP